MKNTWEKVHRKPSPGQANTTFVRFWFGETDSGRFRCQMDEGFGVQEEDAAKPCIFVRHKCRYFKTREGREKYIRTQREHYKTFSGGAA